MGLDYPSWQMVEENPREGFGMTVGEVARQWRILLDARLKPLGLSFSRWAVLVTLHFEGPMSQVELARYIGVEAPSLVRQLDKLEKEGLVRRVQHPADRRIKVVEIDPRAFSICEKVRAMALQLRDEVFECIDEPTIRAAHQALLTIRDRMARMQA